MRRLRWVGAVLLAVSAVLVLPAPAALAAFPGENGKIAFWSSQFGVGSNFVTGVWTIEPDGNGEALLIESAFDPAWSPDGSRLAYARGGDGGADVFTAAADGSGERRLTNDTHRDVAPAWSPDGESIAWASDREGTQQIWMMASDGTGARRLTSVAGGVTVTAPKWSPRGDEIAYFVYADGDAGIRITRLDGSGDRRLTPEGFRGGGFDWAPDASRLVFNSNQEQIGGALYTIRPDGTGLRPIPNLHGEDYGGGGGMGIGGPVFSPDGTKLLYQFVVCFIGRCGEGITLAEADGSSQRTLTAGVRFENYSTGAWQPLPVNRPPDCSGVGADPASLWPPNKKFRAVTISGVTDPDGDEVHVAVTGVTHDEGAGQRDWQTGSSPDQVRLRAERDPHGDGRVYRIEFDADDGQAGCSGEALVTVPRHPR